MDLHDELDDIARGVDVPAGDLDAVIATGRRRQARTRKVVGGLAAIALGTTAVTVITTADDGDDAVNIAADDPGGDTGESHLDWQAIDPDVHLSLWGRPAVERDGVLYALSTAPGQAPMDVPQPLRVWISDDGVEWRDSEPPADDDLYLTDLDASSADGRLYAIGTGQAVAAIVDGRDVPELRIGSSDDGETWTTEPLDVDVDAIAEHTTSMGWTQREIVTDDDGDVLALVGVRGELDVPEVVPEGDPSPERWAITATGVDVLGERTDARCEGDVKAERGDEGVEGPHRVWPDYCMEGERGLTHEIPPQESHVVERSYTWDELGVDGDLLAAVLGRPIAYVSTDGGDYERVDLPLPDGEIGWLGAMGGPAGFEVVVAPLGAANEVEPHVLRSADGTTWATSALPGQLQWVSASGSIGTRSAVVGSGIDGAPVVVLEDGHVARPAEDLDPELVDGREVWAAGAGVGDLGIAIVVGLSSRSGNDVDHVLFTSADGRSWDQVLIEELAGADVTGVGTPIVSGDRVVVSVTLDERDDDGHLVQRALVGTAA